MKKLVLINVLVLIAFTAASQTPEEIAHNRLGQQNINGVEKTVIVTDYGTISLKQISKGERITKLIFTIDNTHPHYFDFKGAFEKRVGSRWTDFTYEYKPIKTKSFNTFEDAKEYYYNCSDTIYFKSREQVHIYKKPKKEKYIVGKFIVTNNGLFIDDYTMKSSKISSKWEVVTPGKKTTDR